MLCLGAQVMIFLLKISLVRKPFLAGNNLTKGKETYFFAEARKKKPAYIRYAMDFLK